MKKPSLLWRITPADGGPASYLFGTMHVRDLRAFGWLDTALQHLAECAVFATEFDFAETDEAALVQALKLPDGKTLEEFLKPGVWKNLDFYCRKKLGIPADQLRHQHPMTVTTALMTAFLADESVHSLDETLWHQAREMGKTTTGVETFADQLATLHKIPFEQQIKSLGWLLKNYGRQQRRMKKMMAWYAAGNIEQLCKAAKKDAKGMRRILLYDRNALMTKRFKEIARENPLFCAVGAGHLAGQKGMLRMLKKAGFKVKPVKRSAPPEG
ncbi:MAG: TraB/GumN family protein [Lewinellaceae bacterium]|nr:TraB/GumN family protein [Lewinellaceae bacterium]